jgi:murein DD-endopeptidase MepM/ murein hydrolase activator NlpD
LREPAAQRVPFGRIDKPAHRHQVRGIRPAVVYLLFGMLCATNVATGVAFMMSDDIARIVGGKNDLVLAAYEDRIVQLRVEIDRLHSRQYAQAGNINLQLQELALQQEVLSEQHEFVRLLAQKASELGIAATPAAPVPAQRVSLLNLGLNPTADDIARVNAEVQTMMDDTRVALSGIAEAAITSTDKILNELKSVGIRPVLPREAMGGPFIAAMDGDAEESSIVDDANAVMMALTRFKAARSAITAAPVHQPLASLRRISSGYGSRSDPFTKRSAFHSGIDFPAPTGTMVLAAGQGEVTFSGPRAGYGVMVEVTHANGLVTRYAHLSATLVRVGQAVQTGTPIAKVGSTGRSTGPHLHFEVRKGGESLDPKKYLAVGQRLSAFVSR